MSASPLAKAEAAAQAYAARSRAPASERAYTRDWQDFASWCAEQELASCPAVPRTVGLYLASQAEQLKTSTLQRRLASIILAHRRAGVTLDTKAPELADVWRGIRRAKGTAKRGKAPILDVELVALIEVLPDNLAGRRDRALLLMMFSAALRRSEVVALTAEDVTWTSEGVLLRLCRSKTDPLGAGELRAVPHGHGISTCPVAALRSWVMAAGLDEGPLFRPVDSQGRLGKGGICDRTAARIVKRTVETFGRMAGWSRVEIAARVQAVSSHSLRAGFATSAAAAGAAEWEIMKQTGHKKRESVQGYIRMGTAFRRHIGHRLGL